jgi:hypothetical protein
MTRATLLKQFPFDPYYLRGNGYREESDFQMNLTVNGFDVVISPDSFCYHLPMSEVRTGGQRAPSLARVASMIQHNQYFYGKYFDRYRERFGLKIPRPVASALFAAFALFRVFLEPLYIRVGRAVYRPMRRIGLKRSLGLGTLLMAGLLEALT